MARKRGFEVSILNIALSGHHEPEEYVSLFDAAIKKDRKYNYYGKQTAIFWEIRKGEDPTEGISGTLYKFYDLDRVNVWLDRKSGKPALSEDLGQLSAVDNLSPDFASTYFRFFPKKHRFYFQSKTAYKSTKILPKFFSPNVMRDFIDRLMNSSEVVSEFGSVGVTVIPTKQSLQKIWSINKIKHLFIEVTPPNPDHDTFALNFERSLRELNAKKESRVLISRTGGGLELNDEYKQLCRLAAENGYVTGKGKDEQGINVSESTKDHPLKLEGKFDPDLETDQDAFIHMANRVHNTAFDEG
ncbi:MAG: DUF4747 family protein [Magnetococcales bacterium]|nr:DUF4747 family protein [Magnetococcales bacterium]